MNKATIKTLIKLFVSGALLAYLILNADLTTLWVSLSNAKIGYLLGGFLLFYVHFLIGAFRWRLIANLHGAKKPVFFYFVSFMVANFFNNFLPSTIGGDVVRLYDTWRAGTSKTGAAATIFADRAVGLMILAVIAVAGAIGFRNQGFMSFEIQIALLLIILGLVAVVFILFYPPNWWMRVMINASEHRLKIVSKLAHIYIETAEEFKEAKGTLLAALVLSFLLHSNIVISYYLVGTAIGLDLGLSVYFSTIPLALIIMMIPISINGIGLREGALTLLLGIYGVSVAQALAFSWAFYGLTLIQGVLGGLVYLVRKNKLDHSELPQSGA